MSRPRGWTMRGNPRANGISNHCIVEMAGYQISLLSVVSTSILVEALGLELVYSSDLV